MDNWIIFKRITWHIDFLGLPWNFLGFHGKFWGKILHLLLKAFVSAGVSLAPKNKTYTFCSDHIEAILGWHVHDTHMLQPQQTLPNQSSSHPIIPQLIKHHWFPATFDPFKIPQCQPPFFQRRYFRNRNQNRSPGGAWSPARTGQSFYTGQVPSSYI